MNGIWSEIKIIVEEKDAEAVENILYTMDIKGLAIEDPKDILGRDQGPLTWDFADINIFEFKDKAVIKAYFSEDADATGICEEIRGKISGLRDFGFEIGEFEVTSRKVNEEDWANNWKKYYKPTKIGERFVVRPLWEEYEASGDEIIISMDPGMAFGTGTHETTRMCLEALERHMSKGDTVFDIGTGSGILAIGASLLGAGEVIGVDLDPVAVDSAKENVGFNALDNVGIRLGNLMDTVEGTADVIVANIIAEIVVVLIDDVRLKLKTGGKFISSGIIREKEKLVADKLLSSGFTIIETDRQGEWVAITAVKSNA
ncbi:50S ribosomal protein L11 methyltransferase [Youngiibacter multivorans]|uniref:Ribosomal protein L11 methyltransferase n=1 Tax=Youngiibacter multivorans TaxID=937251 RepID=A0ABS4G0J0_9CLOT|nr:50S ribosomal protein L11 methyltransferase [Youngiibacter multivorans]MBP1918069.1 ribosomal protein L11 methyltransferase [Youngiibacter multivorans]